jgi:hypothetical protein
MNEIVLRQLSPDDLEPELVRLAMPIARRWEAAALRVAAHHADPKKITLPADADAPETVLARRFDVIAKRNPARAKLAGERAIVQMQVAKTERKFVGSGNGKPVGAAIAAAFSRPTSVNVPLKKPNKDGLLRLVDRHYAQLGMQRTTKGAPFPESNVGFDLMRVVCVDETNGFLGSEVGEDEISISAVTLDESANAGNVDPFEVSSSFDDGDRVDYTPPKRLFTQDVGGGTNYPKHYFATMMMFEVDGGDLDETTEEIFRKFADEVADKVVAALGGLAAGPAGALVGWLVGWLMGKIVSRLIAVWEDDPFVPRTLELIIPSATARLNEPSKVFHFTGPGEYAVRYRWSVT